MPAALPDKIPFDLSLPVTKLPPALPRGMDECGGNDKCCSSIWTDFFLTTCCSAGDARRADVVLRESIFRSACVATQLAPAGSLRAWDLRSQLQGPGHHVQRTPVGTMPRTAEACARIMRETSRTRLWWC